MRKSLIAAVASLVGIGAIASSVYAGELYAFRTSISATGAQGVIGSARAWNDQGEQFIYCGIDHTVSTVRGYCGAKANYQLTQCETTNPYLLDAIRMVGPQSHVSFTIGSGGLCTEITVTTASWYGPAKP